MISPLTTSLVHRSVGALGILRAGAKDGAVVVDPRVDARVALLGGKAREVATVLLHPGAEAVPEGVSVGVGHAHAVDERGEVALGAELGHDWTSARISLACFATSTSR
jgi:hypothetical protein